MIRLRIKGTPAQARAAARKRGVDLQHCAQVKRHFGGESACVAPCAQETAVIAWYSTAQGTAKPGRGYPAGTPIFFSAKCGTALLSGALKAKRKAAKRRRK